MKILRLDLLAFGPFSGQAIDFEPSAAGLHLIYGPNEAGKSSSLRALRQWLYGIPHNCGDNFTHQYPSLRIGGALQDAQGRRLECIRRKARDKSLRGADDLSVVEESAVTQMLGGVDEKSFVQRFGISYEELRGGGQAIVKGGGELGAILFAAGAGIADIRQVRSRLETEMQELFKSAGSNPRINKELAEWKLIRDEIKAAQLPSAKWADEDRMLNAAKAKQAEIDRELVAAKLRTDVLDRLRKASPLIAARKRLLERHAEVADAPPLPDDFASERRACVENLATARQAGQDASSEIARLRAAIDEVTIPVGILEHAGAITRLHTEFGSYEKAAKDRPGLVGQIEQSDQRLRTILRELGRDPDPKGADDLQLGRGQRQLIQELANECRACIDRFTAAEASLRKHAAEMAQVHETFAKLDAPRSVAAMNQAVRRVRKHGDMENELRTQRAEIAASEAEGGVELKRLLLGHLTMDQLGQLCVCESETAERFDAAFTAADASAAKCESRSADLDEQLRRLDERLEALRLAHDVPTEADLVEARRRRDLGWELVQAALRGQSIEAGPAASALGERYRGEDDLPSAFQALLKAADLIADRLRHEAERVAEKAALSANRIQTEKQLATEREKLDWTRAERREIQAQWVAEWTPIGIEPSSPREMRPWIRRYQAIENRAQSIRAQTSKAGELANLIGSSRESLGNHLAELQRPAAADGSLSELLDRCEEVVGGIEACNRKRIECERKFEELRTKLVDAKESVEQASSELRRSQTSWAAAVKELGLSENATPTEANSVIQALDELSVLSREAGGLRSRVEGIDRDALEFERAVRSLLDETARDLITAPIGRAVADLYDRLTATTNSNVKIEQWRGRLEQEEIKRNKAVAAEDQQKTELDAMCVQANCRSVDELPEAERRSAGRREVEKELQSVGRQIEELAGGDPIEKFIGDAEAASLDQVRTELFQLVSRAEELDRLKVEVAEAIGGHRTELSRMDGNGMAAEAQGRAEHVLASLRGNVEQYIRLRLAATVLDRSIERFREASQGDVVNRAGDLFATMSLGSFKALRADYDDAGKATLVGVRAADGRLVKVEGMSDGTCDQLYLAIRLALLESHLAAHEPLPLIVDDILVQFDDDRSEATLKVLAELSRKTQVIVFTHHEHLLDLAKRSLARDEYALHRLQDHARHAAAST